MTMPLKTKTVKATEVYADDIIIWGGQPYPVIAATVLKSQVRIAFGDFPAMSFGLNETFEIVISGDTEI